ncbi:MAG: M23 family metallopeptidase [Hyphomicrobiaceae bacterium]|nr:M23 family metallopeptidase [Hyphomicrobiaceae bacterium]
MNKPNLGLAARAATLALFLASGSATALAFGPLAPLAQDVAARSMPIVSVRCEVPPGGLPSLVPLPDAEPAPKPPGDETAQGPGTPPVVPLPSEPTPTDPPAPAPTPAEPATPPVEPPPVADAGFRYYPPGDLPAKDAGRGRNDRKVWLPDMIFPLKLGEGQQPHMNSQIWGYGGGGWGGKGAAGGTECDPRNYDPMLQRDNYCEVRDHSMSLCPAGKGHQGQDIRPPTCADDKWEVVAVVDGVIDQVTSNTTVRLKAADGTYYRYLHMHPKSITVKVGQKVKQGQVLGRVSRYMGGSIQTTRHLHFDVRQRVRTASGATIDAYVPTWASLVVALRKAKGLDPGVDADGNLVPDPAYEIGAVAPPKPTPAPEPAPAPTPAPPAPAPAPAPPAPAPTPAPPAPTPAPEPVPPAPAPAPAPEPAPPAPAPEPAPPAPAPAPEPAPPAPSPAPEPTPPAPAPAPAPEPAPPAPTPEPAPPAPAPEPAPPVPERTWYQWGKDTATSWWNWLTGR